MKKVLLCVASAFLFLAALLMTACQARPTASPLATPSPTLVADPSPTIAPSVPTSTATPTAQPTYSPTAMPSSTATPMPSATSTRPPTLAPTSTRPPTLAPTSTRPPTLAPTATPPLPVTVYETTISLPTYPFQQFLIPRHEERYNLPLTYLDRRAYDASNPEPSMVDYNAVVLENPYLRLTFMPTLGGRLYSAVVKSPGQEVFYQNKVIKPSVYGPFFEPIEGMNVNYWLAVGGMEWAYPVQEHGYRWAEPWGYEVRQTDTGATITLQDSGPDRVGVTVEVTLSAHRASFMVKPMLTNNTDQPVPVQFWLNAVLALAPDSVSPKTQFIVPTHSVTVHSRGAEGWAVPPEHGQLSWPLVEGRDLRYYEQWSNYLGFFAPYLDAPFMGAYNPETDLGVARLFPFGSRSVAGNKLFAFGQQFPDRSYTDDDSQYFEMWGGINEGFWPENDIIIGPNETVGWSEQWWPLPSLGGLSWANQHVAISTHKTETGHMITALFAQPTDGLMTVLSGETIISQEPFNAEVNQPMTWSVSADPSQAIHLELTDDTSELILFYTIE
ncbi:DUF5107 domain-containing protein [Anaerolineales bacterium HSG24]|nr:DUF5107 domain-containing protein [Anaerolineales bacterium HSG24]